MIIKVYVIQNKVISNYKNSDTIFYCSTKNIRNLKKLFIQIKPLKTLLHKQVFLDL